MTRIVLACMLALKCLSVSADVLLIEEIRQAEHMELPKNAQSKAEVKARYGAPVKIIAAVGDPPISSWKYANFTVYFEHERVLFSVLHAGAVIEK